jgi:hypothetical protein
MDIREYCREVDVRKYGAKFLEPIFDLAMSRARVECVKKYRNDDLDAFFRENGCEKVLEYYDLERRHLIEEAGFDFLEDLND